MIINCMPCARSYTQNLIHQIGPDALKSLPHLPRTRRRQPQPPSHFITIPRLKHRSPLTPAHQHQHTSPPPAAAIACVFLPRSIFDVFAPIPRPPRAPRVAGNGNDTWPRIACRPLNAERRNIIFCNGLGRKSTKLVISPKTPQPATPIRALVAPIPPSTRSPPAPSSSLPPPHSGPVLSQRVGLEILKSQRPSILAK